MRNLLENLDDIFTNFERDRISKTQSIFSVSLQFQKFLLHFVDGY